MQVFLASVVIFILAVLGMAVGTIFGSRTFRGSCRGACGRCDDEKAPQHDRSQECSSRETLSRLTVLGENDKLAQRRCRPDEPRAGEPRGLSPRPDELRRDEPRGSSPRRDEPGGSQSAEWGEA